MILLTVRLPQTVQFCKSFSKMFINFILRNVNNTLLCATNTPIMLYAASPEKSSFHSVGGGEGEAGGNRPIFVNFLDLPLILQWFVFNAQE